MGRRALIVDDNRPLAEDLGEILELEGYEVSVFDDPECVLAECQGRVFDVALIDVRMPGIDGVALHQRLRGSHPGTAFILMTAYADDARIAAALSAGVRRVLTKPVPLRELIGALEQEEDAERELLLLDDDPGFNETLAEVLSDGGYAVHSALSLSEARAITEAKTLHAAVIDIGLPDGDGAAFAAELAGRSVNVFLVTGASARMNDPRLLEDVGGDDHFLLKPFSPERLLRALAALRGAST